MHPANRIFLGVVSATLLGSIALYEGDKKTAYKDVTGTWTACMGVTEDIVPNKIYTQEECDRMNRDQIVKHGKDALGCIKVPISRQEYEAYTSFTYNVGATSFCSSTALGELNRGNHRLACERLATNSIGKPAWSYSKGIYFQGLQNRRQKERRTCLGGVND
jgi:lysozyme